MKQCGSRPFDEPRPVTVAGDGGLSVCVWDYGGKGPPVLFCHCTGAAARVWDPVIRRLGATCHAYAVDTRGHGDSGRPASREGYAWFRSGRDLLAVVDALGVGPGARAVGHSGGGAHIAYAELMRPGAFSRVVLIEPIVGPRDLFKEDSPLADVARRRRNRFDSLDEARRRFRGKAPMNRWHEEALEAYLHHGLRTNPDGSAELKLPGELEAHAYQEGGACDVFDRLGELEFEVLLLAGEESYLAGLTAMQAERLKRVERRIIPATHHFVPQERPSETAREVQHWLFSKSDKNEQTWA